MKSLKEISLPITEEEYRNDGAFHYSTLATFDRLGFYGLEHLYDRKESPSLTFGSMVDTYLTDGEEAFWERYVVQDLPAISDKLIPIVTKLFDDCHTVYNSLSMIPDAKIAEVCEEFEWQPKWGVSAKASHVRNDGGSQYYDALMLRGDKELVSSTDFEDCIKCVNALRTAPATAMLFNDDGNPNIERLFQLKFSAYAGLTEDDSAYEISVDRVDNSLNMLHFSCMMDLAYVDHENKFIIPIDLKTSSHHEGEFYKSFIDWNYNEQARSYWRILRANMDADDYFKDFKLMDYVFVVVNRHDLKPLAWNFHDTTKVGTLVYHRNNGTVVTMRDPFDLARELNYYQLGQFNHPLGINEDCPNDIVDWICQ